MRRVEDITEALWGTRVSPYIVMKRTWAGEVRNVSLLVAIAVNAEGYREILGIVEGCQGGQGRLVRLPQASEGAWAEGRPVDHLGCLHGASRERS